MKKRLLGALILLIITIPIIILGKLPFKLFCMVVATFAIYELIKVREKRDKIYLPMKIISYLFVFISIYFATNYYTNRNAIDIKIFISAFLLFLLPIIFINNENKYNINDAIFLLGFSLFIMLGFNTFVIIRNIGMSHLLYLALITVMTDTFAYVTGRLIGKYKLCPKISPNKTIEGFVGGLLVGTIIPVLYYILVINIKANIGIIIPVTLLFSLIGQLGDLFFSSIKRYYKVKDYSNLIPGHGGVLDRLDSLLFVCITYMLFLNIL